MIPLVLLIAAPPVPEVTIAVTPESVYLQRELERDWHSHMRCPRSIYWCSYYGLRQREINTRWKLRIIDHYDREHPGFTAIRLGRYQRWRPLPRDYWRTTGRPTEFLHWELRRWQRGMGKLPGQGVCFQDFYRESLPDPERQQEIPPPFAIREMKYCGTVPPMPQ